jgi:hypothetical protein
VNAWTKALAEYVAALAQTSDPLTDVQLRRIVDAMQELQLQHHAVLLRALERAKRNATVRTPGHEGVPS